MRTFAEFQIIGRVGKITTAGPTLKINLAAEYGRTDKDGTFRHNTFWNTVTLFEERQIAWITKNVAVGDLVHARGTIRETSWEKDGETRYGVTLAAREFSLLARKADKPGDDAPEMIDTGDAA